MLKIWGRTNSSNVQKVLFCCAELNLPFERTDAGMQFGVNKTPEYKAMNPNGLVPTIDDDGFVLWESHAIVRYLARKHGMGTLWPQDAQRAADADRWMDWYHTTLWPQLGPVFWNLIRTPADQRNMTLVEEYRQKLIGSFGIVDAQLARGAYMAGDAFSMGDIPMAIAAWRWFNLAIERPTLPNLDRWYARICERPAFQRHGMLPLT